MAIDVNSALFSLLGSTYGGDGRTSFGIPDLRGRTAIGKGRFPGSSYDWRMGSWAGTEMQTLTRQHMPAQTGLLSTPTIPVPVEASVTQAGAATVTLLAAREAGNKPSAVGPSTQPPANGSWLAYGQNGSALSASYLEGTPNNGTFELGGVSVELPTMSIATNINIPPMSNLPVSISGSSTPFSVMQPSLVVNYQIATLGTYPSRD